LASDEEVRNLALEVFGALPRMLRYVVEGFLQGVFSGRQPLEDHTSALYRGYEPVRRLLRAKYGPHVRLYRGEPTTIPEERREFLSWAPSLIGLVGVRVEEVQWVVQRERQEPTT
jgi:hypothetical protein